LEALEGGAIVRTIREDLLVVLTRGLEVGEPLLGDRRDLAMRRDLEITVGDLGRDLHQHGGEIEPAITSRSEALRFREELTEIGLSRGEPRSSRREIEGLVGLAERSIRHADRTTQRREALHRIVARREDLEDDQKRREVATRLEPRTKNARSGEALGTLGI